jgi:hypothetical protein
MTLPASGHAGDRSFERNVSYPLALHTIKNGVITKQPNGNLLHEARDPDNVDHVIKVVTTPEPKGIVTVIRDTSRPFNKNLSKQQAQVEANAKASKDRSKANQKAQLEKKRLRSAAARSN